MVAIVAVAGLLFVSPAAIPPARAHFCSSPLQVPVGEKVTFTVGVPAEEALVTKVVVEVPDGFDLHRVVERPPWKSTTEGTTITFTGGPINLFQCAFFTLAGEATEKKKLVVPFTTYDAQGEKIREFRSTDLSHLDTAQIVYAGMTPETAPAEPGEGPSPWLARAGWVLIGGALGGAGLMLFRRRTPAE